MDRLLVVDDDQHICEILEFNLRTEGFEVDCVNSAEQALEILTSTSYDLILLDVMMGGMSGYKMGEKLRATGDATPIIFLTARDAENDMLTGFSVGGDDYISKPFSIKEVIARSKALIKRSKTPTAQSSLLEFDDIKIDLTLKELIIASEKIMLTKTEFEILVLLAQSPDRIFSREEMIAKIWAHTPYITERTVDVHITRLRKKMGDHGATITNRSGYGYRFKIS